MKLKKVLGVLAAGALVVAGLAACSESGTKESEKSGEHLEIVASTGYLADAIKNIAPDAHITTLVKPGGDPHTQELTTDDIQLTDKADLVVWTSHDMEHQMMDHFDKLGDRQLPAGEAIPEDKLLPWEEDGKIQGHDPHIWNSPELWQIVVTAIGEKLGKIDSANADMYKQNAKKYNEEIQAAHMKAKEAFDKIPAEKRMLITGHDAFNYLGKTYGLEVLATDIVSSEAEISAAQLDELAETIVKHKVPKIFQDNLKNPEVIKHLRDSVQKKGGNVEISDETLYADTLGEKAPFDTYLGVFEHNCKAIVEALS